MDTCCGVEDDQGSQLEPLLDLVPSQPLFSCVPAVVLSDDFLIVCEDEIAL